MQTLREGEEMKTMREKFEDRKDIKVRLDLCFYDDNLGTYISKNSSDYATAAYLMGAWYAFQEQQEKIDDVEEEYAETERQLKDRIQELEVRIKEKDYIIESDKLLISKLRSY